LPPDKRFHRFFPLEKADFTFPAGRSDDYTIIEISMFEGRSIEAKKHLMALLFERIGSQLQISMNDIEITSSRRRATTGAFAASLATNSNSLTK
jgi:hypothetical protein